MSTEDEEIIYCPNCNTEVDIDDLVEGRGCRYCMEYCDWGDHYVWYDEWAGGNDGYCEDCTRENRRYNGYAPATCPTRCEHCSTTATLTHWNPLTEVAYCSSCGRVHGEPLPTVAVAA